MSKEKIKHNVLNAKHHEQEAEIVQNAGSLNAVTIATNMAGRGTDIQLGGLNIQEVCKSIKVKVMGFLDSFKTKSSKDVVMQRKEKFLKIGREFIEN